MSTKRSGKKLRTALLAGTLAVAIALTGTFAWTSYTQRALNEAYTNKNPGGRLHDDFDGLNKDIYAENFTDEQDGLPVFVRVRLSEYMETGTYAGRYRDGKDDFNNPIDRGVTIVTKSRADNTQDANINNTDTWPIHKPGATATAVDTTGADGQEEVHQAWTWDLGGSTIYMPTFNKNKDSLSADINGTYVGLDGVFNKDDPYSDYTEYQDGETKTADAYYDADENPDDEWNNGAGPGTGIGDGGALNTNYTVTAGEIHTAKATRGATVLTMAEWEAKGSPIGDYWVWDTDGWAYWAAPLMPQEATGTLLTRIRKTLETDKCYYAINVEGQFATADDVLDETKGFVAADNGDATPNAEALLEKIKNVIRGRDGNWYIDEGFNVYRQLDPVTGQTKALICAGTDYIPGTDDDTSGVIRTDDPVMVDSVDYGTYFLPPDTAKGYSYYRGVNLSGDKLLGTADDTRLWYTGSSFPDVTGGGKLETKGADEVKVTSAGNATQVVAGHTLQFSAQVLKGGTLISDQKVTWTLTGNSSSNTNIDQNGLLTVADNESNTSTLTVKATAHVDDNQSGTAAVTVLDKNAYTVTVTSDHDSIKANKNSDVTETFTAQTLQALAPVRDGTVTWKVEAADGTTPLDEIAIDPSSGVLTVTGKARSDDVKVIVTASYTPKDGTSVAATGAKEFTIQASEKPVVTIQGADNVEAGSNTEKYTVKLDTDNAVSAVTWSIGSPSGVTIAGDKNGATLTVPNDLPAGNDIVINASVEYAGGTTAVTGSKTVTVAPPTGMSFTAKVEKLKKGENGTFTAQVNMNNATGKYASQEMDWSLEGSPTSSNTKLTGTGNTRTLTIGTDETAKELTVIAKSKVSASATVSQKVTIGGDGYDLKNYQAGDIFTEDSQEFLVLYRDDVNHQALIIRNKQFADGVKPASEDWRDSPFLQDTLDTWLLTLTNLGKWAQNTTLKTRTDRTGTASATTTEKVFLLSEADVFGTIQTGQTASADDYTPGIGGKPLEVLNTDDKRACYRDGATSTRCWWLRSPGSTSQGQLSYVKSNGALGTSSWSAWGLRPALWIQIQ